MCKTNNNVSIFTTITFAFPSNVEESVQNRQLRNLKKLWLWDNSLIDDDAKKQKIIRTILRNWKINKKMGGGKVGFKTFSDAVIAVPYAVVFLCFLLEYQMRSCFHYCRNSKSLSHVNFYRAQSCITFMFDYTLAKWKAERKKKQNFTRFKLYELELAAHFLSRFDCYFPNKLTTKTRLCRSYSHRRR